MTNTCSTCKHWGTNAPFIGKQSHRKVCAAIQDDTWSEDAMACIAGSETEALLMTAPTFGCSLWEEKT